MGGFFFMRTLPLLLAGLAVFAFGAWVGATFFQQPKVVENKESLASPRVDTTGRITLQDALKIAEEKFATLDYLHDRKIDALWKANENGAEYLYADIWPPYLSEGIPPNDNLRMAIRVDRHGKAQWAWIRGKRRGDAQPPPKFTRQITLYPEGHLGGAVTIDHEGRVLSRPVRMYRDRNDRGNTLRNKNQ
jgi:hypothetical protein